MSWHILKDCESLPCLQEQEGVSSEGISWDGERFVPSNGPTTLGGYCLPDSETESCLDSRFGMMSKHSTEILGEDESMSSAVDSRAKTSLLLEREKESKEKNRDYGRSTLESSEKLSLDLFSQKTQHGWSAMDCPASLKTLTRWGTMRNGVVSAQPIWVSPIKGTVALLWPTPASRGQKGTGGAVGLKGGSAAFAKLVRMVGRQEALAMSCGTLNPEWSESYLMGFPLGWTDIMPLGMHRFQQWRRLHLLV